MRDTPTLPVLSVEETLRRLTRANELAALGLGPDDFVRLAATAPPPPARPGVIRSLRIRRNHPRSYEWSVADLKLDRFAEQSGLTREELARRLGFELSGDRVRGTSMDGKPTLCLHMGILGRMVPGFPRGQLTVVQDAFYDPAICRGFPDVTEWVYLDLFRPRVLPEWNPEYAAKIPKRLPLEAAVQYAADELLTALWLHPEAIRQAVDAREGQATWVLPYQTELGVPWGPMESWGVYVTVAAANASGDPESFPIKICADTDCRQTDFLPETLPLPEP